MNILPIPDFTDYFVLTRAPEGMCYVVDFNTHHQSDEHDVLVSIEGLTPPSDLSPTTMTGKDYEHAQEIAESSLESGGSED